MNGGVDLNFASLNWQYFLSVLFINLGQIGNAIFLVCSAWFLMESDKIKCKKILEIILDCLLLSLLCLVVIFLLGYKVTGRMVLVSLFPSTLGYSWFVSCYILMYVFHPFLNIIINNCSKKQLLFLDLNGLLIYSILSFLMKGSILYYTQFLGFLEIYFITAYIKKYMNQFWEKNKGKLFIAMLVAWITMTGLTNVAGLFSGLFENQMLRWNQFINPIFIMMSISLFYLFKEGIKYNKIINYLSRMSLLVFVIHNNELVQTNVKIEFFTKMISRFTEKYWILYVLLYFIVSVSIVYVISCMYSYTISKLTQKVSDGFSRLIFKMYTKIEKKITDLV